MERNRHHFPIIREPVSCEYQFTVGIPSTLDWRDEMKFYTFEDRFLRLQSGTKVDSHVVGIIGI